MTEGVDYSFARPGGAALAAAGKTFAARYLTGGGSKAIDAAELRDLQSHGIALVAIFESTADRALGGSPAGAIDGTAAKNAAAMLGIPADRPVYFAVDFDAQPAQQLSIDAYLRGAASVLGAARVGVYGGINVISRCRANGSARWYWQTYAWSAGQVAPWAHLLQYLNGQTINGGEVDLCRSLADDFGQWPHKETPMPGLVYQFRPGPTGVATVSVDGASLVVGATKALIPVPKGQQRRVYAHIALTPALNAQLGDPHTGTGDRVNGVLIGEIVGTLPSTTGVESAFLLNDNVAFVADPVDTAPAVNAALDHVLAAVTDVGKAIQEARPR